MISPNIRHDDDSQNDDDRENEIPEMELLDSTLKKRQWLEDLGIVMPESRPDSEAPPVDEQAILGMVRGTLSKEEAGRVLLLTVMFRSWRDTLTKITRDDVERARQDGTLDQ